MNLHCGHPDHIFHPDAHQRHGLHYREQRGSVLRVPSGQQFHVPCRHGNYDCRLPTERGMNFPNLTIIRGLRTVSNS